MTRVRVDFNRRGANGTVRASTRTANGPLTPGQVVSVFDPAEEDMEFEATVEKIDESGRVLLDVHWKQDDPSPHHKTFFGPNAAIRVVMGRVSTASGGSFHRTRRGVTMPHHPSISARMES